MKGQKVYIESLERQRYSKPKKKNEAHSELGAIRRGKTRLAREQVTKVVGQTRCSWQDCTFRVDWSRQRAEVACLTLHKVLAFF